jgi:hypothetical protein
VTPELRLNSFTAPGNPTCGRGAEQWARPATPCPCGGSSLSQPVGLKEPYQDSLQLPPPGWGLSLAVPSLLGPPQPSAPHSHVKLPPAQVTASTCHLTWLKGPAAGGGGMTQDRRGTNSTRPKPSSACPGLCCSFIHPSGLHPNWGQGTHGWEEPEARGRRDG